MSNEPSKHMIPAGGGLAFLCFFLPWVSCGGQSVSAADAGGILWLVLLAAVGILGAFYYFKDQGSPEKARAPIKVCAVVGLATTVFWYLAALTGEYRELVRIRPGGLLTVAGFIVALYGAQQARSAPLEKPPS